MTRKIAVTCFAALFGFALSAAAQSQPTTPQTPPSTPQTAPTSPYPSSQSSSMEKSDKAGKNKITGCVQSGTTAGTYELTNIKKSGRDSASASSSESASSSSSSSSSKSVKLVAAAGVDLSQHVGHQVEVTGSWSPSSSSSSSASATPPSSTTPPSASASASGGDKEFNVTDVKMVSATCSAGTN